MTKFLAIYTGYKNIQIGLFFNNKLTDLISEESKKVSKNFLNKIGKLLAKNSISLQDLDFIAATKGPAPFTTLRVILATLNGLNFAAKIPLIEVNGLEILLDSYQANNNQITVAILNAFSNDLYYGIKADSHKLFGYNNGLILLENISKSYTKNSIKQITFIGNGAELYQENIKQLFGDRAFIPDPLPNQKIICLLADKALKKWEDKNILTEILPIYLKESII